MANDTILVPPEEMQAAINRYDGAQDMLEEAYKTLDAAKQHMDRCYEGIAYAALAAKYVEVWNNVMSADRAIEETTTGLRNTIQTMLSTEANVGSQSAALETGKSAPTYL